MKSFIESGFRNTGRPVQESLCLEQAQTLARQAFPFSPKLH
ncbi:hypothetical protein [Endozoicomonas numazuensis]|nr:hypothetical protein [Endozoicomonas numazuensis]